MRQNKHYQTLMVPALFCADMCLRFQTPETQLRHSPRWTDGGKLSRTVLVLRFTVSPVRFLLNKLTGIPSRPSLLIRVIDLSRVEGASHDDKYLQ